ncbi:MAG: peptidylprolyl isomerase, partial [Epsilonproteobacteria bacterium]|nr:peptidylprolyl isomerase [Campylobacterota bacterium]
MITWMQKHRKYLVITIWISTIAFVGAGFVGWGAYNYNLDRAGAVAKVGKIKITLQELNQAYTNIYNYYQEQSKGTFTKEQADKMGLKDIALAQLVNESLKLNYAKDLGLETLDDEVEKALENTKAFQKGGVFDKDQYYRVLKNIQMTPKEYEESLRKEITLQKLANILKLPTTPLEIETLGASIFMQDKLAIKIVRVNDDDLKVDENELKKFWEKHKKSYLTKKSYLLSIIKVPVAFIQVDENETKEYYTKKRYNYTDKDGKIESYEQAKDRVIQDLKFKKGKTFALKKYLAFKKGKIKADETKTVFIDDTKYPQEKLKTASVGDVLKPFRYEGLYIVAKLEKVNLPKPMSFEEAKNEVEKEYKKVIRKEMLAKKANQALKDFKNPTDIGFICRDDIKK